MKYLILIVLVLGTIFFSKSSATEVDEYICKQAPGSDTWSCGVRITLEYSEIVRVEGNKLKLIYTREPIELEVTIITLSTLFLAMLTIILLVYILFPNRN